MAGLFAALLGSTAQAALTNCIVGSDNTTSFGMAHFGTIDPLQAVPGPRTTSFTYVARCTRNDKSDPRRVEFDLTLGTMSSTAGLTVTANYSTLNLVLEWKNNEFGQDQATGTATFTLNGLSGSTPFGLHTFTQVVSAQLRECRNPSSNHCSAYSPARVEVATLQVNVAPSCTIAPGSVNFGAFQPSSTQDRDAVGNSSVVCTSGTPYLVKFSGGHAGDAPVRSMRRTGVEDALQYQLYREPSRTTPLTGNSGLGGTGTGTAKVFPIYGRIFGGQFPPPGTYSDTLTMTVEY